MPERTPIIPSGIAPNPALSPGVQVGDLLFVSGNVATDANGNLVGAGNCEAQSRQVMANIRTIARATGATMQDVVKITCFLTNVANYPAYSKVRAETFPSSPPASSTVIVAALVRPEYLVEVEAVVRVPGGG
jgi:enamine deaminase RidA (YjgF/YER057c/UK114 family)